MAADVETIRCNFIGDFKVGDNILANGEALCRLSATNENKTFNKLLVVQAGSIVEAAPDQIIYRAQNYTKEGVPNIPADDLKKIRETKIDRFNNIIQAMKTHKLLDRLGGTTYDDLHRLRKLRNISSLMTSRKDWTATIIKRSATRKWFGPFLCVFEF
jgi:hypothetical protein